LLGNAEQRWLAGWLIKINLVDCFFIFCFFIFVELHFLTRLSAAAATAHRDAL